jgi:hypothetical protein
MTDYERDNPTLYSKEFLTPRRHAFSGMAALLRRSLPLGKKRSHRFVELVFRYPPAELPPGANWIYG